MSSVLIVGASSGIGRDIQPYLSAAGHDVQPFRRNHPDYYVWTNAMVFCQRYRVGHVNDWLGEIKASLSQTKEMIEVVATQGAFAEPTAPCSIVVMASVAGVSVEEEQPVSYHACKAALIEMVKYYAVTLGPKQIRVNAIIPGLTIKPEARAFYDANPELEATYGDITPLGRMGTVEDIANLVDFLISPKSSYLTGQTITLDGGIGLRSHWALARKVHPTLRTVQVTQRKPTHV
jgi:NAD(P)-dependent dehydrogenase (short-subunit alcohol dehydrogenase family)